MLVGKKAPFFSSPAVLNGSDIVENFSLSQYTGKKYVLFFFYPGDFTFVCPTELIAFQNKIEEFRNLDVEIVACSVDSEFSHWKWLQTPKNEGGIKGVEYPIVADFDKTISQNYHVFAGEYSTDENGTVRFSGDPVAYRGLFLIDKEGIIRHLLINDLSLGRSVDEALRMVKSLQFVEKHGEVCPANWNQGEEGLVATQVGISEYLSDDNK